MEGTSGELEGSVVRRGGGGDDFSEIDRHGAVGVRRRHGGWL